MLYRQVDHATPQAATHQSAMLQIAYKLTARQGCASLWAICGVSLTYAPGKPPSDVAFPEVEEGDDRMESRLSIAGQAVQPILVMFPLGLFTMAIIFDLAVLGGAPGII